MQNSKSYEVILELIKLFLNDSLHGILKRPIFQNRWLRKLIIIFFLLGYGGYFYLNAVEFAKLHHSRNYFSEIELQSIIKLSVLSYNNLSLIIGALIFILLASVSVVKKSSLFIAKLLPYETSDLKLAIKLFKLGIAAFLHELFFIVMLPGLQVIGSLEIGISLFISCHLSFFTGYLLSSWIFNIFNKKICTYQNPLLFVLPYFILLISYFYFGRFYIEQFLAHLVNGPKLLSLYCLLFFLLSSTLLWSLPQEDYNNHYLECSYIRLYLPPVCNMITTAIYRTKLFLFLISGLLDLLVYLYVISDFQTILSNLLTFLPFLGLTFLTYAYSTLRVRCFYKHLGITVRKEFFSSSNSYFSVTIALILFRCFYKRKLRKYFI
ncbi:hypothetical protein ACVR0B_04695 [Streptococcus didelphis]|uniref:hypothetical protein n=1 Tax=Streptococcus didelphis TaxID=102886 RepID=UPI00037F8B89|nr:hypothetical protein [Streptococcus didelphis]